MVRIFLLFFFFRTGGTTCSRCFRFVVRSSNVLQVYTDGLERCYTTEEAAQQRCPTDEKIMAGQMLEIVLYSKIYLIEWSFYKYFLNPSFKLLSFVDLINNTEVLFSGDSRNMIQSFLKLKDFGDPLIWFYLSPKRQNRRIHVRADGSNQVPKWKKQELQGRIYHFIWGSGFKDSKEMMIL